MGKITKDQNTTNILPFKQRPKRDIIKILSLVNLFLILGMYAILLLKH